MKKILTIVIPTYNMERYLSKCLSSLLLPDEDLMESLEVLVINDGSKDDSSKIAHEFENKYPNTFRVIDKENGNYGSCVNRGLKEAQGKYIKILDADDSFNSSNFLKLLKIMKKLDVDMIVSDYRKVTEDGEVKAEFSFICPNKKVINISDFSDSLQYVQMHAVMYKTENLKRLHYKQTEGIPYTDSEWVFYPISSVETLYYFNETIYEYLVGRSGQTVDLKVLNKKIHERMIIIEKLLKFYEQEKNKEISPIFLRYFETRLDTYLRGTYISSLIMNRDAETTKRLDNLLKTTSEYYYHRSSELLLNNKYWKSKFINQWRQSHRLPSIVTSILYKGIKKIGIG